MIAKVALIVIHSGGRLSATMVNCGNSIIIVWTSLQLSVVLRVSLSTPCSKALISPHGKVCFQQNTLTFDSTLSGLFWEKASGFEERAPWSAVNTLTICQMEGTPYCTEKDGGIWHLVFNAHQHEATEEVVASLQGILCKNRLPLFLDQIG